MGQKPDASLDLSNDKIIKHTMTVFPVVAEPSQSIQTVLHVMKRYDIRHIPVVDKQITLGVLYERELACRVEAAPAEADRESVRNFIRKVGLEVSPEASTIQVIKEMQRKKEDCTFVVKDEKLVGIFTDADAIRFLLPLA